MSDWVTAETAGFRVSVATQYQVVYSKPDENHFVFAYQVVIENRADFTAQLRRRHWVIEDSNAATYEVEGEGVVGEQPILEPGDQHEYVSGCHLKGHSGAMHGTYLMKPMVPGDEFKIKIPRFSMQVPDLFR